nr:4Fe-4S binding protein [Candidatus Omnitrophota bacterium]
MKRLLTARRLSQSIFLALFIYILWSTTYPLKGVFPASAFFKFDPLIVLMVSLSSRVIVHGIIFSLSMIILSVILGRFFCGWACPLGAMVDIFGNIRRRYPRETDAVNSAARKLKFFILAAVALAASAGIQIAWIFDPMVIMGRFVSLNLIPTVTLALDSLFIFIMRDIGIRGMVQDIYRAIEPTILGVRVNYFSNSLVIFVFFLIVCSLSVARRRLWCRAVCPLGAIYAIASRKSFLKRRYGGCSSCGICKSECRMGAIRDDLSYERGECILCMDCVYNCPDHVTHFGFYADNKGPAVSASFGIDRGISRKGFLVLMAASFASMGFKSKGDTVKESSVSIIRPPAALKEPEFLKRCIRCGNCMKVCITNGLQPVFLESGLSGIWTPKLVPDIGYCEYQCTLCGHTCPTGAIPALSLENKMKVRIGIAEIDRSICLPWAEGKECIVCQEHCPVPDKAIK